MSRLIIRAITDETMRGMYIATAPNPISQADFMRAMRRPPHTDRFACR